MDRPNWAGPSPPNAPAQPGARAPVSHVRNPFFSYFLSSISFLSARLSPKRNHPINPHHPGNPFRKSI
ncbi:hypothetical protein BRADI_1g52685v3 [Brachypodium distachyon]|uniref:Uncharacterized protein n=1 Tax=Brachypodium distachyon TaxID=15368 RepID=A0A0Q3JQW2_BRADI|nr:hypothetical protein BRADI_1g52685v3 [Brachypodium distachyon]